MNSNDTIDVVALSRLLWAQKYLIAIIAGIFGAVAVVLALTATPKYQAQATVTQVADSGLGNTASRLAGQFGGLASLAGIDLGARGVAVQEAHAILESRRLLEEFIRRNDLVDELLPPGGEQSLWWAVQNFRDSVVSISTDELEGTSTVTVEWTDPAVAANWANGIVALANELMRAKALVESQRNIEYLKKQIAATNVVEMQRVMYGLVENETKKLMLANARADYAFTVVDPAVMPEARVSPKRRLMVMSGVAIGLLLATLFVLGRDTVRKYRSRETAEGAAGSR